MWLWDKIKSFWSKIKNFFRRIINGVLNFFKDVIHWFASFRLRSGQHVPFVVNANSEKFKKMIHEAPTKDVGIFQGIYDMNSEEISDGEYIEADSLDVKTRELLGQEELVVLS